jgi:hypothetical protein
MRGGAYYDKHGIPIKRRGDKALYIFAVSATKIFGPGKELQSSTAGCNHRNLQKVDASSKAKDLATSSKYIRKKQWHACMHEDSDSGEPDERKASRTAWKTRGQKQINHGQSSCSKKLSAVLRLLPPSDGVKQG